MNLIEQRGWVLALYPSTSSEERDMTILQCLIGEVFYPITILEKSTFCGCYKTKQIAEVAQKFLETSFPANSFITEIYLYEKKTRLLPKNIPLVLSKFEAISEIDQATKSRLSQVFEELDFASLKHVREDQGSDDRRIGLDHEHRSSNSQFSPSNLLRWWGPAVRPQGGRRVTDLTEKAPKRRCRLLQILPNKGNNTNRKVTGNSATDLEESDWML